MMPWKITYHYYIGQNLKYARNIPLQLYSMCSLVVSVLDSPAVDPRSNPGSGSALLMSENLRLNTTSPVVIC